MSLLHSLTPVGDVELMYCSFRHIPLLLLLFVQSFSLPVLGGDMPSDWGVDQGDNIPWLTDRQEMDLDRAQREASRTLLDMARWLDSFFENERAVAEENTTRGTLRLSAGYSSGTVVVKPRFDWRLRFPRLSSRALLVFENTGDQEELDKRGLSADDEGPIDSRDGDFAAGLKYFIAQSRRYHLSFDTVFSGGDFSSGMRFRVSREYRGWQATLTDRLRLYIDDGLRNIVAVDLGNELSEDVFLRASTSVGWRSREDGLSHGFSLQLFEILSPLQVLSYETAITFATHPSHHLVDHQLVLKYRQRFFRDWLVLQVSPRVSFPADDDRRPDAECIVSLEAIIGYRPHEAGYRKVFH